jgi:hypothetical protein
VAWLKGLTWFIALWLALLMKSLMTSTVSGCQVVWMIVVMIAIQVMDDR